MQIVRSSSEVIFEHFKESLSDLIACYTDHEPGIGLHPVNAAELEITSLVGLSSPEVSATVSISTSQVAALSLSSFPLASAPDWLGELVNQLAGRLKNKLCNYGLSLNLSTPTTVRGNHLSLSSTALETFVLTAEFPKGLAVGQLSLNVDAAVELHAQELEPTSDEGSLELF